MKLNKNRIYKNAWIIAVLIIILIFISLTLYSGVFPPASVVESYSMEHSSTWQYGMIDEGTVVFVKKVTAINEIKTYVTGSEHNYTSYGEYGNVILYHDYGNGKTIIHRAMFYLYWNNAMPEIRGYHNQKDITVNKNFILMKDVGYAHRNLIVNISGLKNESGFITAGDHNLACLPNYAPYYNKTYNAYYASDQALFHIKPVKLSDIVGIAYGYIPWYGLIKLNVMRAEGKWPLEYADHVPEYSYAGLFISLAAILTLILFPYKKIFKRNK